MTRSDWFSAKAPPYEVRHPDWIMVGRDSVIVGQANDPAQDFYDSTVLLDLWHIVRLEPLETAATGNGFQQGKV